MTLNAVHMPDMSKPKEDRKQHQITVVITADKANLFKNKILSINISRTKTDVFIAIVLKCSRLNLLIFICYVCNICLKNVGKINKR